MKIRGIAALTVPSLAFSEPVAEKILAPGKLYLCGSGGEIIDYCTETLVQRARQWLDRLKDKHGQAKIFARIARSQSGNFGDHKGI